MKKILLSMCFLFISFSFVNVNAQESQSAITPQQNNAENLRTENNALVILMQLNENEIAAANLAEKKSKNRDVIQFAKLMINNHSANLKETQKIAKKEKISTNADTESNNLKEQGQKELNDLSALNGADFDKKYAEAMVSGHEAALKKVEDLAANLNNPEIKKHFENTIAVIKTHLQKAKTLKAELTKNP